jgi:hypothetical protein
MCGIVLAGFTVRGYPKDAALPAGQKNDIIDIVLLER